MLLKGFEILSLEKGLHGWALIPRVVSPLPLPFDSLV